MFLKVTIQGQPLMVNIMQVVSIWPAGNHSAVIMQSGGTLSLDQSLQELADGIFAMEESQKWPDIVGAKAKAIRKPASPPVY